MDAYTFIKNNEKYIWLHVHSFAKKYKGYGTYRCSEEDLYQECIVYILEQFQKNNNEAFAISPLSLTNRMCLYMMSTLPTKQHKSTVEYTKVMQKEKSVSYEDAISESAQDEDSMLYDVLISQFRDYLPDNLVGYFDQIMSNGGNISAAASDLGINHNMVNRAKRKIGNYWNRFVMEQHEPIAYRTYRKAAS